MLSQDDVEASCDITKCLAFSVFKCICNCSVGLRSGVCRGRSMTVRTPWSPLVFSGCVKALRRVWANYPAAV